ncbi:MAG: hypothetical protein GY862_01475, partial [Gammaproteobacteria bacterium]|nr:hypothetical protein [Gammaproteobacteria bacterium]
MGRGALVYSEHADRLHRAETHHMPGIPGNRWVSAREGHARNSHHGAPLPILLASRRHGLRLTGSEPSAGIMLMRTLPSAFNIRYSIFDMGAVTFLRRRLQYRHSARNASSGHAAQSAGTRFPGFGAPRGTRQEGM